MNADKKANRPVLRTLLAAALWALAAASSWGGEKVPPRRIVSLLPSHTEILFDLGAGDQVVGVTNYCDYPDAALQKEKIGDFIHPNFEKIIFLKPDLVLAGKWKSSRIVPRLRQAGIAVEEFELPATVEDIYDYILKIAGIVGREEEGRVLAADMRERVDKIVSDAGRRGKTFKIFIEVDTGNWTVSKQSFISDAAEKCGAVNIFRDLPVSGAQVSNEAVLEKNPDAIIISETRAEEIKRRPGWAHVAAVKNGNIIDDLGKNFFNRPTPRLVTGMENLARRLSEIK